jgi:thiamine transporter ThiT
VFCVWVFAYLFMIGALVIALRLILKFIKQSGLSKNDSINYGMIAVHILACVLQCVGIYLWYSSTLKLGSPDLSCE